jgi:hypothetical protein
VGGDSASRNVEHRRRLGDVEVEIDAQRNNLTLAARELVDQGKQVTVRVRDCAVE